MDRLSQKKDILYIIIPAYNEEANIEKVIEEWYPVVEKHSGENNSRLVIIDDGSTDSTYSLTKKLMPHKPMLYAATKKNGGHGQAVLDGYRYAILCKADYVFQTDSDRQTSPDEFEAFWRQRNRFDAVIGNRYSRKDGISRVFISKAAVLLLALCARVWIPDANTPFRLIKAEALKDALNYIGPNETVPNLLLTAILKMKGYKVLFRDITFKKRSAGKNSVNLKIIIKTGVPAFFRLRKLKARLRNGK